MLQRNFYILRALGEAVVLSEIIVLLLQSNSVFTPVSSLLWGWGCIFAGVVYALRIRLMQTSATPILKAAPVQLLKKEIGLLALLLVAITIAFACLNGVIPQTYYTETGTAVYAVVINSIIIIVAYVPIRLLRYLLSTWLVQRRHRLLWSIAHAQLITILFLLAILIIGQAIRVVSLPPVSNTNATPLAGLILQLLQSLTISLFTLILAIPVVLLIMALAVTVSYFIARPIAKRINNLVDAAERFRSGNYSTRIMVSGQDEIALLEQHFNALASDLEHTVAAYKTERDTVKGLLQNHRELVATASHELRTPLATTRGYLDSIFEHWPNESQPPPNLRHDLEILETEIRHLQSLVDDLFALSRAEVGQLTLRCTPTVIAPIIEHIVGTTAVIAWQSKRIRVSAEIDPTLPLVDIDTGRLQQILHNLLHNAIRHTPPGGIVQVTVKRQEQNVERVCLSVRDTGEGIEEHDLPFIWDRFYRGGKNNEGGSGLGLALVKALTQAMEGDVSVDSQIGKGSCFHIFLPSVSTHG
ncbi:MAG: HAMP domain-containing protein [Anaerolineaceae bacterium]|nr:HAMP domain-containing protein [Anaerolineaceae bacterium]